MTARRGGRAFLGLLLHPCKSVTARCVWGRGLWFPELTHLAPAHHAAARLRFPHAPPHRLTSPSSNLKRGSGSPVSTWIPWAGSWECERESPSAGQSLLKHPLIYCSKKSGDPGDLLAFSLPPKQSYLSPPEVNGKERPRTLKSGVGAVWQSREINIYQVPSLCQVPC